MLSIVKMVAAFAHLSCRIDSFDHEVTWALFRLTRNRIADQINQDRQPSAFASFDQSYAAYPRHFGLSLRNITMQFPKLSSTFERPFPIRHNRPISLSRSEINESYAGDRRPQRAFPRLLFLDTNNRIYQCCFDFFGTTRYTRISHLTRDSSEIQIFLVFGKDWSEVNFGLCLFPGTTARYDEPKSSPRNGSDFLSSV